MTDSALIRELEAERDRARASLEELIRERNTWARQMADLRDEAQAARDQFDIMRGLYGEADMERTVLQLKVEDLTAERDELGRALEEGGYA